MSGLQGCWSSTESMDMAQGRVDLREHSSLMPRLFAKNAVCYSSCNLIGPYHFWRDVQDCHFWVISPRNLTSFTRPFLTGRRARAGHETKLTKEDRGKETGGELIEYELHV